MLMMSSWEMLGAIGWNLILHTLNKQKKTEINHFLN